MKFTVSIIFVLTLLMVPEIAFGQLDRRQEGFSIKPIDSSFKADFDFSLKLSPIVGLTRKNITPRINYTPMNDSFKKKSGVNMAAKSTLVKPTWDVNPRFTEEQQDISQFSSDYYLGDIRTSSKTVVIKCRDHEYVDGDRIRLMVNDVIIHPNLTLSGEFYAIDIDLKDGLNTIHFIALNEGMSRPNTAQLKVLDENNNVIGSNRWFITTGYKASLTVIKQ